jgi:hypothetical protein
MSFLREHGEKFQQIGSSCVTMAEQARRDADEREASVREQTRVQQEASADRQRRLEAAKAAAQDSRENHLAASALLAVLALIAGAAGAALFLKDRSKAAIGSGTIAVLGLCAATFAFFSRPSLQIELPALQPHAPIQATPVAGKLICQIQPGRSRITVSSTDDLPIDWQSNGCMNGRTQYVQDGATWRRVLVPNGSETVFVQDFDPVTREYVSTRYLLPQPEMDRLRQIRAGDNDKSCASNSESMQNLQQVTAQLASALPASPNEKLVYRCAVQH